MSIAATILIVDDEAAIRRLLRTTPEAAGYVVIAAATAAEAFAELARTPALVLIDLGLPDRDGLELLPIMAGRARAAALLVSARDATKEKVAALDLGASTTSPSRSIPASCSPASGRRCAHAPSATAAAQSSPPAA